MTDHTDLLQRLRELAHDKEARLTGTPMIPLHENTIISVIDAIERLDADNAMLTGWKEIAKANAVAARVAADRADRVEADNAALRNTLELIEMETRDDGVWGLRDVNEVVQNAMRDGKKS